MAAFLVASILAVYQGTPQTPKRVHLSVTGSASYDTNGSTLDLSSANTDFVALDPMAQFTRVDGVSVIGVNPHGSDKYVAAYVRAASGAPATGKLKVRDLTSVTTGTPGNVGEVSSTADLSGTTFFVEVIGT
jgi:hypothetical protein